MFNKRKSEPVRFPKIEDAYKTMALSNSLEQNVALFESVFKDDDTIVYRRFGENPKFCLLFVDSMIDSLTVNGGIIAPIEAALRAAARGNAPFPGSAEEICAQILSANELKITTDFAEIFDNMLYGDTLILTDGCDKAIVVSTKSFELRAISSSENEKGMSGPQEAFGEALMINLSLIRRKLRTPNLKFTFMTVGRTSRTTVSVCYLESSVDKDVLSELRRRLEGIDLNVLLDSNYINEYITDARRSPFRTVGATERPDIAAAKLCEGKIVVVVDGSPTVLTLPFLAMEYFQNQNDYYLNFFISSLSRFIRYVGFFVSISLPAVYLSVVSFNPEILPSSLLTSILQARRGVPFPTAVELILMLTALELLQEAGLLSPASIGQPLSIVGGLVLGQAAVDARFVSAPVLIVVAVWAVTNMMLPLARSACVVLTYALLLMSALLGLYGYMLGIVILSYHLCSLNSFGVPYVKFLFPLTQKELRDTFMRAPLTKLNNGKLDL